MKFFPKSREMKVSSNITVLIAQFPEELNGTNVRYFEEDMISFLKQDTSIVLDCSFLKYLNSSCMGILIKMADKFTIDGKTIGLLAISQQRIALFEMLGLLSLFNIYKTEEEILEYYKNNSCTDPYNSKS